MTSFTVAGFKASAKDGSVATTVRFEYGTTIIKTKNKKGEEKNTQEGNKAPPNTQKGYFSPLAKKEKAKDELPVEETNS